MRKQIIVLTFIVVTTVISGHVKNAHAQQVTLSMNPPIVEAVIKPGKTIVIAYTVTNSGDPVTVRMKIRTFSPQGQNGALTISDDLEGPVRFSLDNANLQFDQPLLMRSGAAQQAVVRMRIPEGTPEDDYYYVFLAETESSPGVNGSSGSTAKASIGSPLLVTVTESGKVQIKGDIASLHIPSRFQITFQNKTYHIIDSSDKIPVSLTIRNNGNNLFKPEGTLSLQGWSGDTLKRSIVPQNVLSQSERKLNCTPDCIFSGFFIGPYRIIASVKLSETNPALSAEIPMVGIPFKVLSAVVLTSLITLGVLLRNVFSRKPPHPPRLSNNQL